MFRKVSLLAALLPLFLAERAGAVTSAEIYTSEAYQYGRFTARIQFAPGSGVVSSFFMWKDGSEVDGAFWNELDIEKLEAECRVETNTIYGNPEGLDPERAMLAQDLCSTFHVYAYEWTPEYIAWSVDGVEIRRETGAVAVAFSENTAVGMQLRFNVWPGDASFGGEFSPSILPVYEYIDWVEYSSYANGDFELQWREDFNEAQLASRWSTASWDSPKGLSTHAAGNAAIIDGYAVLALTSDDAPGVQGASPAAGDTAPATSEPPPDSSVPPTDVPPPATSEPAPVVSVPEPAMSSPPATSPTASSSGDMPVDPPTMPTEPSGAGGAETGSPAATSDPSTPATTEPTVSTPAQSTTGPVAQPVPGTGTATAPTDTAGEPSPAVSATPDVSSDDDDGGCSVAETHGSSAIPTFGFFGVIAALIFWRDNRKRSLRVVHARNFLSKSGGRI